MRPMIGRRDPTGGLLKSDREREFTVLPRCIARA